MPDSIAASITFALASASMRQPKLLQPSPTTETSSEPILHVCMKPNCENDLESQATTNLRSRLFNFRVARLACWFRRLAETIFPEKPVLTRRERYPAPRAQL